MITRTEAIVHKKTSSPESRAAQASMAARRREADRAQAIAADYAERVVAGRATAEQADKARAEAARLAAEAEQARVTWEAERFLAGVVAALAGRPVLDPGQAERLRALLVSAS